MLGKIFLYIKHFYRVAIHRVVPCLAKEFVNPHMIPFVLPSVLAIAEEVSVINTFQNIFLVM